jgi:outer membrane receptor protein involved in Fe transport
MKKQLPLLFILISCLMMHTGMYGQETKLSGYVSDLESSAPLEMANIAIKGTKLGTISDENGFFKLMVPDNRVVTLQVSYIGYKTAELEVTPGSGLVQVKLEADMIMGAEVVISASRVDERIMEAPLTIQKVSAKRIQNAPSGDYFGNLTTLRDVDIINNSIGFKIFNARGFNTAAPLRVVQFIDGVDNQLPTINIVPGDMFGVSELDIADIEVISGPASAMYGPNAMQGVLSVTTKDPFKYRGVSVMVKAGNREFFQGQFRYADVFANGKLGLKITGSAMTADDWVADNPVANRYGNQPTPPQNFNQMIQNQADAGIPIFQQFSDYAALYPEANPGNKQFIMPGYMESELYNGHTDNYKVGGGIYYQFAKDFQISYEGRYSTGTSMYMGNNRAPLEGFAQYQHALGLDWKGLSVKAYMNKDNTNNTYSLPATGVNMGFQSLKYVDPAYLGAYVYTMEMLSNGFTNPLDPSWVESANSNAMMAANGEWLQPGTEAWNEAFDKVVTNNPPFGSNFSGRTTIYHLEALYNINFEKVDLNVGASFRNTNPVSDGTIFSDTLVDGKWKIINVAEYGGFAQAIWDVVEDRFKIFGSVRLDKSTNYDLQVSPRLAFVYNVNQNNVLRLTGQSAFRSPAVSDQYQLLNKGVEITVGNVEGFGNVYTANSVNAFVPPYGSGDPSVLETTYVEAVQPEQLKSIELGYNGLITKKFFIDLSVYYNIYSDFIGYVRVVRPNGSAVAGEQSGVDALQSGNYKRYHVATNTKEDVNTYGASIGLSYFINPTLKIYGNYTYSQIDSADLVDGVIPGFNTPEHKVNLGITGKIYKGFGFALNWRWADNYYWEAVFASGPIPAYNVTDLSFSFEVPRLMSTLRIGGSNIFNVDYIQAYGMPEVGGFYYGSWTFNVDFAK